MRAKKKKNTKSQSQSRVFSLFQKYSLVCRRHLVPRAARDCAQDRPGDAVNGRKANRRESHQRDVSRTPLPSRLPVTRPSAPTTRIKSAGITRSNPPRVFIFIVSFRTHPQRIGSIEPHRSFSHLRVQSTFRFVSRSVHGPPIPRVGRRHPSTGFDTRRFRIYSTSGLD